MIFSNTMETKIYNISLKSCLYNASGVYCTEKKQLDELRHCDEVGAIVTKSCTLNSQHGNPIPRYYDSLFGSINSMGLPNNGFSYYSDYIFENSTTKPIMMSVACNDLKKLKGILLMMDSHIKLPEFNLSCPNLIGKGQICYNFESMEETLRIISEIYGPESYGVKLSPYFEMGDFSQIADLLNSHNNIKYITSINSLGNGLMVDVDLETVTICPKNGFGGVGGVYCLPTALANVRQFYTLCPRKTIVGCGGVMSGRDAFSHILCGASAVQIGTALCQQGPLIFKKVSRDLRKLMELKGYTSISQFKGHLKYI